MAVLVTVQNNSTSGENRFGKLERATGGEWGSIIKGSENPRLALTLVQIPLPSQCLGCFSSLGLSFFFCNNREAEQVTSAEVQPLGLLKIELLVWIPLVGPVTKSQHYYSSLESESRWSFFWSVCVASFLSGTTRPHAALLPVHSLCSFLKGMTELYSKCQREPL